MTEEEIQPQKVEEVDKKKNLEKMLKLFGIIVAISGLVTIFFLWYSDRDFPLLTIILFALAFIVVSLGLIFGVKMYDNFKKKNNEKPKNIIPEPKSRDELIDIVNSCLVDERRGSEMNHVKSIPFDMFATVGETSQKNKVFVAHVKPLYKRDPNDHYVVIINAHYPDKFMSILSNPSQREIRHAVQSVGGNADDKMDVEEVTTSNPILGTTTHSKKVTHSKKDKPGPKSEKKEEIQ